MRSCTGRLAGRRLRSPSRVCCSSTPFPFRACAREAGSEHRPWHAPRPVALDMQPGLHAAVEQNPRCRAGRGGRRPARAWVEVTFCVTTPGTRQGNDTSSAVCWSEVIRLRARTRAALLMVAGVGRRRGMCQNGSAHSMAHYRRGWCKLTTWFPCLPCRPCPSLVSLRWSSCLCLVRGRCLVRASRCV